MELIIKTSKKRQVVDITDNVQNLLPEFIGVVNVFVEHSTAAISTANLDPGTDLDLIAFTNSLIPEISWRHQHNPKHAPDHLLASLYGPSITVPFGDKKLILGTWQRIILIEFDGGKDRKITLSFARDY